jgi:hypothetical protein
MEIGMLKKFASSFILASALVGSMVAPSFADDDTFKNIVQFPVKVVGSSVAMVVGVPMGAIKDGVKGSIKSTKWASGKLGSEDSGISCFFGSVLGGPVGFVGGGAYGCFDGAVHGAKTGYSKPFSHDAFTFKDE